MAEQSIVVTILGRRWRLKFTRLKGDKHGWCDGPEARSKKILINTQKRSRKRIYEDIIHEALHAADWDKSEEWVDCVAHDIARIIFRLEANGFISKVAND